jgi:hypothetical protein
MRFDLERFANVLRRLRVFDQHHPVCATKEWEHLLMAQPPLLC